MANNYDVLKRELEALEPIAELSVAQRDSVLALASNSAFKLLLSYMQSEVQGNRVQLTYLNLSDNDQRHQAIVIQGRIQGLERVRETLLELVAQEVPTEQEN